MYYLLFLVGFTFLGFVADIGSGHQVGWVLTGVGFFGGCVACTGLWLSKGVSKEDVDSVIDDLFGG